MNKPFKCNNCGKRFKTAGARKQHNRDAHTKLADLPDVGKEGAKAVLNDVYGDASDGVYWAMAEEFGLEAEDLIDD